MTTNHLTPAELDALLEAAQAATSGEWLRSSLAVAYVVSEKGYPVIAAFAEYNVDGSIHKEFENGVANQEFVIRANPATITRLVLMVRDLQERLTDPKPESWQHDAFCLRWSKRKGPQWLYDETLRCTCAEVAAVAQFCARAIRALRNQRAEIIPVEDAAVGIEDAVRLIESLPLVETEDE